jgi:hypothetical protein
VGEALAYHQEGEAYHRQVLEVEEAYHQEVTYQV